MAHLTSGQVAAAANIKFETFRVWVRRYPDQLAHVLGGLGAQQPGTGLAATGSRAWSWRKFTMRDALLLDIVGLLTAFGSGPDTALRLCENLSHRLADQVWSPETDTPDMSGRPFLMLTQEPHRRPDPEEVARGIMPSRARVVAVEIPGQPYTRISVISAEELSETLQQKSYPALIVDIASEWARVQARVSTAIAAGSG